MNTTKMTNKLILNLLIGGGLLAGLASCADESISLLSAAEEGFVAQIQRGGTRHMGVGLIQHAVNEFRPLTVGVGHALTVISG